MAKCQHKNTHRYTAEVVILEDRNRFHLEMKVQCEECQAPFRFIGLPMGVDLNSPTVNFDGCKLLQPIYPAGEEVPDLPDDEVSGFSVYKVSDWRDKVIKDARDLVEEVISKSLDPRWEDWEKLLQILRRGKPT